MVCTGCVEGLLVLKVAEAVEAFEPVVELTWWILRGRPRSTVRHLKCQSFNATADCKLRSRRVWQSSEFGIACREGRNATIG